MQPTTRKRVQVFLAVLLVLATARVALIWYERHEASAPPPPRTEGKLPADYYVVPKKSHAYDLESLRQAVVGRPVWIREGFRWTYFPFAAGRSDFSHPAGQFPPLDRLEITSIATGISPEAPGQKQVLAVFTKEGKEYAFPVGAEKGSETRIYIDEMVYLEDPHQLYRHWSDEVWDAIAHHQVKPGMNQLQASFAVGFGHAGPGGMNDRTVRYPNGGQPVEVTFQNDRAVSVTPVSE